MVALLLALASPAVATPGYNGALHIGAQPIDEVAWAGTGGGVAWLVPEAAYGVFGAEGGLSFAEKGAVHLMFGTDATAQAVPVALAGRWLFVDGDDFRFAATLQTLVVPIIGDEIDVDWKSSTATSPGIAIDTGGRVVRFDLALPIWGITSYDGAVGVSRVAFPLYGTMGINFVLNEKHRIRFGVPELFSWHVEGNGYYFDLGGVTIGVAGAVWGKIGARF
jgi:hypothetical protein